jgi:WD40 repeat protein
LVNADDNFFVFVPESDEESFVSIWSAKEKQFLTAYQGHTSQISQIVFMKYRNYVATSSWDCTVRIWPLYDFEKEETVKIFNGNYPILDLKEFNEDILVLGGDDCYLVFWNWKKNEIVKKEFGHAGSVMYIQMVNDLKLFTAGGDNKFKYWEICAV